MQYIDIPGLEDFMKHQAKKIEIPGLEEFLTDHAWPAPDRAPSASPMNRQIRAVIADLRAHGQPPPSSAVHALKTGAISEIEFRTRLGILPVTPDGDAFGEYWRHLSGRPGFHVSNFGRARCHRPGDGVADDTTLTGIRSQNRGGIYMMRFDGPERCEWFTAGELLALAFGPAWTFQPPPDPDPPGEAWRGVPDWPAYEVSGSRLVRSYHGWRGQLSDTPRRLLRPYWDAQTERLFVRLADGHGFQKKITLARLFRLVWGRRPAGTRALS